MPVRGEVPRTPLPSRQISTIFALSQAFDLAPRLLSHSSHEELEESVARRLLYAVLVFLTSAAHAYDKDTHFYEMYLLARYAGINHDVSLELATFNQYIDNSLLTTPFQVFPLFDGIRRRRMFHFPSNFVSRYTYNRKVKSHGIPLTFLDQTQPDSPVAHEMIYTGLKHGNFMLTAAGLHVLMDSYGHSPFAPAIGHASEGHAPDRPYQYPEKHSAMTKTLFKSLVVIRSALPESAIDRSFRDGEGPAHSELNAQSLFEKYEANEKIQKAMKTDILRDPRYVREVVAYIIREGVRHEVFNQTFNTVQFLEKYDAFNGKYTAEELVYMVVQKLFEMSDSDRNPILNPEKIFKVYMADFYLSLGSFHRLSPEDREQFMKEFARRLVAHIVPTPLNKDQPVLYEYEGAPRELEMRLRLGDRQNLIFELTGKAITYSEKNFRKTLRGLVELNRQMTAENPFAGLDELSQKIELTHKAWLASSEIGSVDTLDRWKWRWYIFKYFYIDYWTNLAARAISTLYNLMGPSEFLDLKWGNARLEGSKGTFIYNRERAFKKMMAFGIVKKVLTDEDVHRLQEYHHYKTERLKEAELDTVKIYGRVSELEKSGYASTRSMTDMLRRNPLINDRLRCAHLF